ncbi:isopentenyl-diphosphate Delta-isomerase [Salmonella enterica subsp. enterica]|nr:isopentenyl-diphosphate Delta-isomerase [Salmonella enterica subsp. enterica]ECI0980681.1 isopentenyl-diphosphate Delta-isomerase [Salmonella enterica subsp. enterica serovar Newport]ECI2309568.1 isopentenyl-diphosphate Delta-isomerase [Salmonella enterica subsp. enterica serovar Infantis]ECO0901802.1 isopentenyl-diphosphate Delta-isomerase [Salmonella enterica subsp. enterica serovar Newport]ECO1013769.1 isopentenyl-diphosphate Delta-isomerase [Salmonella enterica subsp. enterica serovar Ne
MDKLILIDRNDNIIGSFGKTLTHKKGILHRAVSVYIINSEGKILLQQRAKNKYHSGGLWSNTCCTHPRPGEEIMSAAKRRLKEEMGIECNLLSLFPLYYNVDVGNGFREHEITHVFYGVCSDIPVLNPEEAASFSYTSPDNIIHEIKKHPEKFTEWFKFCFPEIIIHTFNFTKLR